MKKNRKGFKDFYIYEKHEKMFEKTFVKYFKRGHWGEMKENLIREQQKDWFEKMKKLIEDKDYGSLLMAVSHRDNKVSREMFSRLTNINIKTKTTKNIEDLLEEFCFPSKKEEIKETVIKFKDVTPKDFEKFKNMSPSKFKIFVRKNIENDKNNFICNENELIDIDELTNKDKKFNKTSSVGYMFENYTMSEWFHFLKDIGENGLKKPICIDSDNNIIEGRFRIQALKQLGWTKVPIIRS